MWGSLKSVFASEQPTNRRVQPRLQASAESIVKIDSKAYPIKDWSAAGILVEPYNGSLIKGQRVRMEVLIKDGRHNFSFEAHGLVVRAGEGKMAAKFFMLEKYKRAQIAEYFAARARGE